jgi:hypothetical protein
MAVQVRDTTSVATGHASALSVVIPKPTGTVDGDKLQVLIQISRLGVTFTAPSGWTLKDSDTANIGAYYYEKTASSEPSDWTWTASVGGDTAAVGLCAALYDDAGAGTPVTSVYTKTVDTSADTTADNTGVTPTAAPGELLLALIGGQGALATFSAYAVATNNPTWVEDEDINRQQVSETCSAAMAHATGRNLITATGAFSATISTSLATAVWLISVQPAGFTFSIPAAAVDTAGITFTETAALTATIPAAVVDIAGLDMTPAQADPEFSNQAKNAATFTNQPKS